MHVSCQRKTKRKGANLGALMINGREEKEKLMNKFISSLPSQVRWEKVITLIIWSHWHVSCQKRDSNLWRTPKICTTIADSISTRTHSARFESSFFHIDPSSLWLCLHYSTERSRYWDTVHCDCECNSLRVGTFSCSSSETKNRHEHNYRLQHRRSFS